jgi:dTDP-4-amino-4,6-dideoxygalactose transaminase
VVTPVPLVDVAAAQASVAADVLAELGRIVEGGRFVLGPRVEAFERWLAAECGVGHAIGVASGTDAIELSLRALDVGPGDAVVTPSFSFVAAAEAIAATGARPSFCDVDLATMNATGTSVAEASARAVQAGLRPRAVVPVHLFGRCAPMADIMAIAEREGLAIVEDAAQAIGARGVGGAPVGGAGRAGCFSFFPSKNLGAWGDGGAVVTADDALAARVRRLRTHGAVAPYVHAELGRNSRLDAIQAAVLLAKAPHIDAWASARERIAEGYARGLRHLPLVLPTPARSPERHGWHAYVVRVPQGRDALAAWMRKRGIETRVYYPAPLHRQAAFQGADAIEADLPAADEACRTALALPMFPTLTEEQQASVVDAAASFFAGR